MMPFSTLHFLKKIIHLGILFLFHSRLTGWRIQGSCTIYCYMWIIPFISPEGEYQNEGQLLSPFFPITLVLFQSASFLPSFFHFSSFAVAEMPASTPVCPEECQQGQRDFIVQKVKNRILIEKFTNIKLKWMWCSGTVCQLTSCQDNTHI